MRALWLKSSIFAFFAVFPIIVFSQNVKYSNEFLAIGVGAKSLSMSGAVIAQTHDNTAMYWNPAGLTKLSGDFQLGAMHAEYFAGIAKYDYGSICTKIDNNTALGIGFIRFAVDDIPNTSELIDAAGNINYDKISSFSAADNAFFISFAKSAKNIPLQYGFTTKIINRKVGDFAKSWGFGIDLGLLYHYQNFDLAFSGRDITTTFNTWSYNLDDAMKEAFTRTGNSIPVNSTETTLPRFIVGAAYKFKINSKIDFKPEFDFEITTDGKRNVPIKSKIFSLDPKFGIECGLYNMIYLRSGIGKIQKYTNDDGNKKTSFEINAGIGVKIKNILSIDYAFTDLGDYSSGLYSNVFSLSFNIHKKSK